MNFTYLLINTPFFQHNLEGDKAFVQPIIPVNDDDTIKFAVNFYNLGGLVNLNTIKWKEPYLEPIPSYPKDMNPIYL